MCATTLFLLQKLCNIIAIQKYSVDKSILLPICLTLCIPEIWVQNSIDRVDPQTWQTDNISSKNVKF